MNIEQLVVFLLIGGVAGWLAGLIIKSRRFGIIWNIVVGVIGSVLGGWIFGELGISVGGKWMGPLVTATAGAIVLLFAISLVQKK
ncbi:MAG: GlsB/YeaQ/YmgE family stress response membrane protein [Deltaproteobacteria bacterium]|nr:GlsB/YeaQ/YmgE family stress response membrane protein [Deltaproteobacteria bacterium]MCW9050085.1 GlsB/YeaQ/YmgE family stress response membrane protein [Deltaproteobacteria bacterium]